VGDPSLEDPKRTLAPDITKENIRLYEAAVGKPAEGAPVTPTGPNEPPRSDQPSQAPLQLTAPKEGTGVGVSIVSAPSGGSGAGAPAASGAPGDPNALVKPVGPTNTALPAAEKPAEPPNQVEVRPQTAQTAPTATDGKKQKKPKADLDEESSSKKKKKKGLGKLNPF
jgi:outer membrane protein assembly factor BamD